MASVVCKTTKENVQRSHQNENEAIKGTTAIKREKGREAQRETRSWNSGLHSRVVYLFLHNDSLVLGRPNTALQKKTPQPDAAFGMAMMSCTKWNPTGQPPANHPLLFYPKQMKYFLQYEWAPHRQKSTALSMGNMMNNTMAFMSQMSRLVRLWSNGKCLHPPALSSQSLSQHRILMFLKPHEVWEKIRTILHQD